MFESSSSNLIFKDAIQLSITSGPGMRNRSSGEIDIIF